MQAILGAALDAHICAVISNKASAGGLEVATKAGIPTQVVEHRKFADRAQFDLALADAIEAYRPDLIVLAGFLRILTAEFITRFEGRIMNIHPSLLPAFPGLDTHRHALAEGVRFHGCTVHFVTPELDHGPIVLQAAVPVLPDDNEQRLAARVLEQEHIIYPQAIRWFIEDRLAIVDGRVSISGEVLHPEAMISPLPQ